MKTNKPKRQKGLQKLWGIFNVTLSKVKHDDSPPPNSINRNDAVHKTTAKGSQPVTSGSSTGGAARPGCEFIRWMLDPPGGRASGDWRGCPQPKDQPPRAASAPGRHRLPGQPLPPPHPYSCQPGRPPSPPGPPSTYSLGSADAPRPWPSQLLPQNPVATRALAAAAPRARPAHPGASPGTVILAWEETPQVGKRDRAATPSRSPRGGAPRRPPPAAGSRPGWEAGSRCPRCGLDQWESAQRGSEGRAGRAENPARGRRAADARYTPRAPSARATALPGRRSESPGPDGPRDPGPGADPTLLHLGRGGAALRPREGAVAGHRPEGVQHQRVHAPAPRRLPGHQPLRRAGCNGECCQSGTGDEAAPGG